MVESEQAHVKAQAKLWDDIPFVESVATKAAQMRYLEKNAPRMQIEGNAVATVAKGVETEKERRWWNRKSRKQNHKCGASRGLPMHSLQCVF